MLTYLATKTAESNHPNANNRLIEIIREILSLNRITSVRELEQEIDTRFDYEFQFRHIMTDRSNPRTIDISISKNILFWLIANGYNIELETIISQYQIDWVYVDDNGNTLFHIAAYYCNHSALKLLIEKSALVLDPELITKLLNQRNQDGTNMLGMILLNMNNDVHFHNPSSNVHLSVVYLINQLNFDINAYLNNKLGMDYKGAGYLQEIGGFNCLHVILRGKSTGLLTKLKERNDRIITERFDHDALVNFYFPTMNPKFHMISPQMLLKNVTDINILTLFKACLAEQESRMNDDDSGDSSDDTSSAHAYREVLREIVKQSQQYQSTRELQEENERVVTFINEQLKKNVDSKHSYELEQLLQKIVVPHFHGVPFMHGHYTNKQRRQLFKRIFIESDKGFGGLHSRTSTATAGLENLYFLVDSDDNVMLTLDKIDDDLKLYLSKCWDRSPDVFFTAIKLYVYNFSDNPIQDFWERLARIIPPHVDIIKYRFPFISSSKAPDHPVKFALGVNVETQARDEKSLAQGYDQNAKPNHRLTGFLYITFHTLAELLALDHDKKIIDMPKFITYKVVKTGNVRTDQQLETTFFAGIDKKNIKAVIPMVYPNLSKPFKAGYHDSIWNLVGESGDSRKVHHYGKAKRAFLNNSRIKIYDKNITPAGKIMMSAYVKLALKIAAQTANAEGKILCYVSADNTIHTYPIGYFENPTWLSEAQDIIRGPIDSNNPTEYQKRYTPEKLEQEQTVSVKYAEKESIKQKFVNAFITAAFSRLDNNKQNIIFAAVSALIDGLSYTSRSMDNDRDMRVKLAKSLAEIANLNVDCVDTLLILLGGSKHELFLENCIFILSEVNVTRQRLYPILFSYLVHENLNVRGYAAFTLVKHGYINSEILDILLDIFDNESFSRDSYTSVRGNPDDCDYDTWEIPEPPQRAISLIGKANADTAKRIRCKNREVTPELIAQIQELIIHNTFSVEIGGKLISLLESDRGLRNSYEFSHNEDPLSSHAKMALENIVITEREMLSLLSLMSVEDDSNRFRYHPEITNALFSQISHGSDTSKLQIANILLHSEQPAKLKEILDRMYPTIDKEYQFALALVYLQIGYLNSVLLGVLLSDNKNDMTLFDVAIKNTTTIVCDNETALKQFMSNIECESDHVKYYIGIKLVSRMKPSPDSIRFLYRLLNNEDCEFYAFLIAQALYDFNEDSFAVIHRLSAPLQKTNFYRPTELLINFWRQDSFQDNSTLDQIRLKAARMLIKIGVINSELVGMLLYCIKHSLNFREEATEVLNFIPEIQPFIPVISHIIDIESSLDMRISSTGLILMSTSAFDLFCRIGKLLLNQNLGGYNNPQDYFIFHINSINFLIANAAISALIVLAKSSEKSRSFLKNIPIPLDHVRETCQKDILLLFSEELYWSEVQRLTEEIQKSYSVKDIDGLGESLKKLLLADETLSSTVNERSPDSSSLRRNLLKDFTAASTETSPSIGRVEMTRIVSDPKVLAYKHFIDSLRGIIFNVSSENTVSQKLYGLLPYQPPYRVGDCLFVAIQETIGGSLDDLRNCLAVFIRNDDALANIILLNITASENTLRCIGTDVHYHSVEQYCALIAKSQTWGTELEIIALSKMLRRPIGIITPNNRYDDVYGENEIGEPIFVNYINSNHYAPLAKPDNIDLRYILDCIKNKKPALPSALGQNQSGFFANTGSASQTAQGGEDRAEIGSAAEDIKFVL